MRIILCVVLLLGVFELPATVWANPPVTDGANRLLDLAADSLRVAPAGSDELESISDLALALNIHILRGTEADAELVRERLDRAADKSKRSPEKIGLQVEIAKALTLLGDADAARVLLEAAQKEALGNKGPYGLNLAIVAGGWAVAGDFERGESLLKPSDEFSETQLICMLAESAHDAGLGELRDSLLVRARRSAQSAPEEDREDQLRDVVRTTAELGDPEVAHAMLGAVPLHLRRNSVSSLLDIAASCDYRADQVGRDNAFIAAIAELERLADRGQAGSYGVVLPRVIEMGSEKGYQKLTPMIKQDLESELPFISRICEIAFAAAMFGDKPQYEKAIGILTAAADSAPVGPGRAQVELQLAAACAAAGDLQSSDRWRDRFAKSLEGTQRPPRLTSFELTTGYCVGGNAERAIQDAQKHGDANYMQFARAQAIRACVGRREFAAAWEHATQFPEARERRLCARRDVVVAMTRAGAVDEATAMIKLLPDSRERALFYLSMARTIRGTADTTDWKSISLRH